MSQKLQKYTARALSNIDETRINDGITARNPLKDGITIESALKKVGTHLLYGSKKDVANNSCWISHSKDFRKVISDYSYSSNYDLHKRSDVVIIENYNTSLYEAKMKITSSEELKKAMIDNISLLNLDFSTKKSTNMLFKLGLLIGSNGDKYFDINCMPLNYAACSSELLSLNNIQKDSIKYILNALMADIVYAISYCNIGKSIDEIIDDVVSYKNDILNCIDNMDSLFIKFYEKTYEAKKEIYNIVEECDLNKNDPLAIELCIIDIKRSFLRKILDKVFNFKDVDINLLEDRHHLATIGVPNQELKIELFNQTFDLKKFEYDNMGFQIEGVEMDIVAMVDYKDLLAMSGNNRVYTCIPKLKRLYYIDSNNLYKCSNRLNR